MQAKVELSSSFRPSTVEKEKEAVAPQERKKEVLLRKELVLVGDPEVAGDLEVVLQVERGQC